MQPMPDDTRVTPPQYVVARKAGTCHAVYAHGGPEDGTLYGFFTVCEVFIDTRRENWVELHPLDEPSVTCEVCIAALVAHRLT